LGFGRAGGIKRKTAGSDIAVQGKTRSKSKNADRRKQRSKCHLDKKGPYSNNNGNMRLSGSFPPASAAGCRCSFKDTDKDEAAPANAWALGCYFFSAFLICLSAFFSLGVLAGSFLDAFLLSWPLLMIALLFVGIKWSE
jgi:hypothetical protein